MGVAVETVLAGVVAGLDLDQADVEAGVTVVRETESAGHVDGPDDPIRLQIIGDRVSLANLDTGACNWDLASFPRSRGRPETAGTRPDQRRPARRCFRRGQQRDGREDGQCRQHGPGSRLHGVVPWRNVATWSVRIKQRPACKGWL